MYSLLYSALSESGHGKQPYKSQVPVSRRSPLGQSNVAESTKSHSHLSVLQLSVAYRPQFSST